jgi:hypothetical protein
MMIQSGTGHKVFPSYHTEIFVASVCVCVEKENHNSPEADLRFNFWKHRKQFATPPFLLNRHKPVSLRC